MRLREPAPGSARDTRLYDAALRPSGLSAAQFTLLQALNTAPGMSQKQLASLLEFDSPTLTRTLKLLHYAGWLRSRWATLGGKYISR